MKSPANQTLGSDNFVVIIALLATVFFAAGAGKTQQLQKGISVQLATTTGAGSWPEADNADAWIVTVTENNELYFGANPVTSEGLLEVMRVLPRTRGQELFVKADGRASFATVAQVLKAARADMFDRAVLLTGQFSGAKPGTIVAPKGLPLWVSSPGMPEAVVVEVGPGQGGAPTLKIDKEEVPLKALQHKLTELLQGRSDRVVVLKPGQVPFADVVHVVDVCNMSAATPVLATPTL